MSQRTASLDGVRLKIKRAKEHLYDLEANWSAFLKTNPYSVVPKDNPESGNREFVVTNAKPLPKRMALMAGDSVHNLRSALDQLIWQLILANGGDPEKHRSAFPVWKSEHAFKSGRPGDAKGVSKAALDILYAFKPYKGGNEALWLLHHLDVVDKHRLLIAVASAQKGPVLDLVAVSRSLGSEMWDDIAASEVPLIQLNANGLMPMVVGEVLFAAPLGEKHHDETKFPPLIALNEQEIGQPEPLIPMLKQLFDAVEAVALKLGAEIP